MKLVYIVLLSFTIFGCATMIDGSKQVLSIDSSPQGATIYVAARTNKNEIVKKRKVGVTPMDVTVSRKDAVVILELQGYETIEAPLMQGTNSSFYLDILALSLLSTSVDASTGAMYEYDPGKYLVEMQPIENN